ncbi:MAG: MBL fold metallo-hydrolase [Acidobacteria bacterium]|nr:MBL fold metallo-hydrolase [Acidobacteriota bacterium]
MLIRFWGVRGSTPTPQRENAGIGGNTPCLELRTSSGQLFIFDCGTGFRLLGRALEQEYGKRRLQARIFLTHFHWDHIQGIPFFNPLYNPRNQFLFHSYRLQDQSLRRALEGQMSGPYFPVDMREMGAERHFFEIGEERVRYDDLTVTSKRLNHPQGCLGYRIESNGKVIVYATDNEPGDRAGDRKVRELADGADILIYDAQFLPEEMKRRRTWGHSHWKEGVRIAKECKARKLVLFHHDPDRSDPQVRRLVKRARDHFDDALAAYEGLTLKL